MTNRLDRIEAILDRTAQRQEEFDAQLNRIALEAEERGRNLDARLDRIAQISEKNSEEIDLLAERIGSLAEAINELRQDRQTVWELFDRVADGMIQFQNQASADRTEIRRIWEYLLSQHPNGHTNQ